MNRGNGYGIVSSRILSPVLATIHLNRDSHLEGNLLAVMFARNPSRDNQGKDSFPAKLFVRYVITEMLPDKIRDSGQ